MKSLYNEAQDLNLIVMKNWLESCNTLHQDGHYSPVMFKLKTLVRSYENDKLVGVLTLGWGTNPMGTIKKMFPELTTDDYYEIGKMCMDESMPRNSESQMIMSDETKYTREKISIHLNRRNSWKLGYVYQINFYMVVLYGVMYM